MKDTWLSRGSAAPRYPYWSFQQLCGLMAPLPRGVYWWLPLIPFSWKKHTRRDLTACVMCVCMCRTVLSVPSHTPVVTVIPGSKIGPVAKQPCHPRSWPISILHLEERGLRSLRQRQVDQKKRKWLTLYVPWATVHKPNSEYSCFLKNTHLLSLVVYFLPCFAEFMLVSLINTESDINTVHPGDQETTPLRF